MWLLCRTSIDCGHHIVDSEELLTKKCASQHGHTYNFEIALDRDMLKEFYDVNFVDFELLKQDIVQKILGKYDHKDITQEFKISTVEDLCRVVKHDIITHYNKQSYTINYDRLITQVKVKVFETSKWGVEL